jgi:Cu(I)/Ag(I) efflux system membrane fusion protein/cobalt-zinc-cadmium efflux system membrane fusion protein
MNTRRLLVLTIALNVLLASALLWIWLRRHGEPSAPVPQTVAESPREETPTKAAEPKLQPVQLSPERMQSIGVTFSQVEMRDVGGEIRATGNVDVDERRLAYVQTRFAGWLRKVHVNATYQFVQKGQPLFTVYSPELVATEQEYLLALKNRGQLQTSSVEGVATGAQTLAAAARDRLRQWEISEAEINKLEATGKPVSELTIYSPVSGYVTERNALPNMYVQPETRLYTVADLATVWVNAQVFQNDLGKLKPGNPAEVTVDAYPGRTFRGRVEQILPQVDMNTRTVRVRLSFANPSLLLKPGMFVNVTLKTPMGKAVLVPASAIVHTGAKQIAFVDKGDGMLDPRDVLVGDRAGDAYVVRSGLKAGERVVTSANFLIDSESQLQAAAGSFAPPPPGAGAAAAMNNQNVDAQLTTEPDPPHKGSNVFRVKLSSADGKPMSGAQVTVTFFMPAMPAMGMAEMKTVSELNDKGNGLYEGKGELGSGGTWQVTIVAKQNGQAIAGKQMSVSATGGM